MHAHTHNTHAHTVTRVLHTGLESHEGFKATSACWMWTVAWIRLLRVFYEICPYFSLTKCILLWWASCLPLPQPPGLPGPRIFLRTWPLFKFLTSATLIIRSCPTSWNDVGFWDTIFFLISFLFLWFFLSDPPVLVGWPTKMWQFKSRVTI